MLKKSIIGDVFGESGQLEIIGISANNSNCATEYLVKCSVCSKDPELYGDGIFKMVKRTYLKGSLPCGCCSKHHHTAEQKFIIWQRKLSKNNFTVVAIKGTKIEFNCNVCGKNHNLFYGSMTEDYTCSSCHRIEKNKLYSEYLATLPGFDGYKFWKSPRQHHWYYECPVCSFDEEVKTGRCSGIFEIFSSAARSGCKACRCSGGGFKNKNAGYLYILKIEGDLNFTGYGITHDIQKRLKQHRRQLKKVGSVIEEVEHFYLDGQQCRDIENTIRANFELIRQNVDGFKREATLYEDYAFIVASVNEIIINTTT